MSKDYERLVRTSESLIEVAMISLMLKRLAKQYEPFLTRSEGSSSPGV